jgi:hypothetical protein
MEWVLPVRSVCGAECRLQVSSDETVGQITRRLHECATGAAAVYIGSRGEIRLLFAGAAMLAEDRTLGEYGISAHDFVVMVAGRAKQTARNGSVGGAMATTTTPLGARRAGAPASAAGSNGSALDAEAASDCRGKHVADGPPNRDLPTKLRRITSRPSSDDMEDVQSTAQGSPSSSSPTVDMDADRAPPRPSPPPPSRIKNTRVQVNRGSVMVLWAAAVAQRCGHDRDSALTLGRAVANAYARLKAAHIGLPAGSAWTSTSVVSVLGREVAVASAADGRGARALDGSGRPMKPSAVWRQLEAAFGAALPAASGAMSMLASVLQPTQLEDGTVGYQLYERFRPSVPAGTAGWGAVGWFELATVLKLKDDVRTAQLREREATRLHAEGTSMGAGLGGPIV